jgi:hypothetical protein
LHEAIRGSTLVVIPEGEHWMVWHLAERVAEEVTKFMP